MSRLKTKRKQQIFSAEDFEIRESSIKGIGKGLFSKVEIRKGDTIGYYEGKVLDDEEAELPRYANSAYLLYVCKDHYILGEGRQANYTRYVNHSNRPNIEMVNSYRWKTCRFQAIKRIRPGEELFLHYGPDYADMLTREPN